MAERLGLREYVRTAADEPRATIRRVAYAGTEALLIGIFILGLKDLSDGDPGGFKSALIGGFGNYFWQLLLENTLNENG